MCQWLAVQIFLPAYRFWSLDVTAPLPSSATYVDVVNFESTLAGKVQTFEWCTLWQLAFSTHTLYT